MSDIIRRKLSLIIVVLMSIGGALAVPEWGHAEEEGVVEESAVGETAVVKETTKLPDENEILGRVTLAERLQAGGATMVVLALLSVGGVAFALERIFGLRVVKVAPSGLMDEALRLWEKKDYGAIEELCRKKPSTLSRIISAFLRHRHCGALELSELASDIAGREMRSHLQKIYPIAVVATLAPLLGLLGTVIGMIEAFEIVAIVGSLGDASMLAGSISKALVTTATGLIIAVPALAVYHAFKGKTAALANMLEEQSNEILTSWFMDKPSSVS